MTQEEQEQQEESLQKIIIDFKKVFEEVMFDEIVYGVGGYCLESDGNIRKATQEELYEAINNPETIKKDFTLKDIKDAISKVGLDKDLDAINKAMAIDYKELMKDYKPIVVVDDKRVKYYCPNGVEITFNDEGDK